MTPAQARALIAGPARFAPVRIDPMPLMGSMQLRRVARALRLAHGDVILRLLAVWSWQAAAWSPSSPWGDAVPVAVVDLLFGVEGASAALVRCHVALAVPAVGGVDAVRIEQLPGAPNIRAWHSSMVRWRKGGAVCNERRRARSLSGG